MFSRNELMDANRGINDLDGELVALCRQSQPRDQWERVNSSPFARVYRFEHHGKEYYHKTFLPRGPLERLKSWLQGSRAQRAWRGGELLKGSGLGAPVPVLVDQCGADSIFVTEAVADSSSVMAYWHRLQSLPPSPAVRAQRNALLRGLGDTVGYMHRHGIHHGDLRCGNIQVTNLAGALQFVFLDNERTVRYRRLPDRLRLKNLVQLGMHRAGVVSNPQRWRFWLAYLQQNPELQDQARHWVRRISRKTAWRLQRRLAKRPEPASATAPGRLSSI